ncbi:MAG: hypothetical protein M1828_004096 [Chrysothrix sp. TS-e1954]|nr:MAG: hypothetical protein M1828_004096 [Chrysothrix sp. TS-e1954]
MFLIKHWLLSTALLIHALPLVHAGRPFVENFNDEIMCFGEAPPPSAGWPDSRPGSDYISNQQLCPKNSRLPNLGCTCLGPNTRPICALITGADHLLFHQRWDADYTGGWTGAAQYCEWHCYCGQEEEAKRWQARTPQEQSSFSEWDPYTPEADHQIETALGLESGTLGQSASAGGSVPGWYGSLADADTGSAPTTLQKTCNATSCDIQSGCSGDNCHCKITGAQYEPSAGHVEYFASCSGSILNKRQQPVPCPCNSTYVSHACCDKTSDGLVREEPWKKLGELVKREL